MGAFDKGSSWTKLDGKSMGSDGDKKYSQTYQCTKDGEYRFRFIGEGWTGEMCPEQSPYNLTNASCKVYYTNQDGRQDNYFYVNMVSGKTYIFTFDNSSEDNRTVACTVSDEGSGTVTPIEKYCSFYLIGNLYKENNEEWADGTKANPFNTIDGKTYTYTFTGVEKTVYFRVQGYDSDGNKFEKDLAPDNTEDKLLSTNFETVVYKPYNSSPKAWYFDAKSDKTYTITLNYSDTSKPQIKYTEGGSSVVTKVIKLLNGSSELTGSNGSYTLDLSGETSSDANITLTIDGVPYGLATAQTISAAGTTNVDFVANATAPLTLTKGFIYSLSVTDDGKMTVVAKDNPYKVAGAGFYLVGDFMSPYNHSDVNPGGDNPGKINYERLYFKFEQQTDGSYKIDIPACLTAKMQILGISVDGVSRVYGPSGIKKLYGSKDTGTANPKTNGSLGGTDVDLLEVVNDVTVDNNYWNLKTRNDEGIDDDGLYEISFKYDSENKTPTVWTIKHDALKRVAYLLSDAKGATAQPVYTTRSNANSAFSDVTRSALHFNGKNGYYVLGYIVNDMYTSQQKAQAEKADDGIHVTKSVNNGSGTHDKLFFLGNGGYEWSTSDNHNKLRANFKPFTLKLKGTKVVTYNPNQGYNNFTYEDGSYGMTGELKIDNSGVVDYPDAISMVGPAIPSTTTTVDGTTKWLWKATAGDMTYDESDRCYKLVLNTSAESFKKTFRFVGDHDIAMNWYEDDIKANDDYPTSKEGFSDATVADPNVVNYTSDCTENTIVHDSDIKWNRGAGLWTVRFYIIPGKDNKNTFQYTITGASKIYIPVTAHMGKLLRTYTSAVDVVPVDKEVLIYAAQSYTKNNENNTGSGDETGTVKLYRLKYIPANQGVILFAPNSPLSDKTPTKMELVPAYSATVKRYSSNAFDYVERWADSQEKESIWVNKHENETWNNFLVPVLTDTNITQFYFDDQNNWTGRNFAFTRYSQTKTGQANGVITDNTTDPDKHDYFSFFRAAGTVKASYSYLMLPRTIMEGNGQILDQSQDNDTKLFSKSMGWFEGIDAPMDNETTGISELKNHVSNTDAAYYTLQGVKVAKPVKGIYIHQGKKVIVK